MSFYSSEKKGEILLNTSRGNTSGRLSVSIRIGNRIIGTWEGVPEKNITRIPVILDLPPASYRITCNIRSLGNSNVSYLAATELVVLKHKANEVKTDRLTGGLIANNRPFYPFGFYCYSPVPAAMPEEEVVRGFNMISPYQTILPETFNDRKAYMDRCAQIGMKVHYNLLSLAGGGGIDSRIKGLSADEKKERLVSEIKAFMDHPALLAWYISDEPNGYKIPPETLEELYSIVKKTDPWHPVSMVFMAPFLSARKYSKAFDIVMADPYPVPRYPVTMVGDVTGQLRSEFEGKKPVWMVIQSFGGGEWWDREPTVQEVRSMTWQAIINGATAIQYFVRQGPNYFPKSVSAWNECSGMAMEVAELSPWLLSDEKGLVVQSSSADVSVTSRTHNGKLLILAVNKQNIPAPVNIRIKGFGSGKANVIFENRSVAVTGGQINDRIGPYGSEAYIVPLTASDENKQEGAINLLRDPGFEITASPGVPSACYARPGGDPGATYFTDTREAHEGDHSLRLITPVQNKGVTIRMFPIQVRPGSTYAISVWAKNDPEQQLRSVTFPDKKRLLNNDTEKQFIEINLGSFGCARFAPEGDWKRFMTFITIPGDSVKNMRTNLIIRMPGQGVAWLDDLKIFEEKR